MVTLTEWEFYAAAQVGLARYLESIKQGLSDKHGFTDRHKTIDMDVYSALSEMVLCKYINRYWPARVNNYKEADIGKTLQVRHSLKADACLIIRKNDVANHRYALVTGEFPRFMVRGHILGSVGMQEAFLKDYNNRPDAYFVPQSQLTPFKIAT